MSTAAAISLSFQGWAGLRGRLAIDGAAAGHLVFGALWAMALLAAAWRWKQRRWIALAVAMAILAVVVALTALAERQALALHAAGVAGGLIVSGGVGFVSYLRRAPMPDLGAYGE